MVLPAAPPSLSPLPINAAAISVMCLAEGSATAKTLAEAVCRFASAELTRRGHKNVSSLAFGDERSGEPSRLIVGFRLTDQTISGARPEFSAVALAGQTFQADTPNARLVPAGPHVLAPTAPAAAYEGAVRAILSELGL